MSLTVTFDTSKLNRQMEALYDALIGAGQHSDAATIVRDESRRLLKQCQRFTPPKTLAQGRTAVKRDIGRAMTPVDPDFFRSPKLRERVREIVRKRDIAALRALIEGLRGWTGWKVEEFSRELHRRARVSRGRVLADKKIFIIGFSLWRKYVAEVQKRVGYMRSGWLPAYEAVGGTDAPSWVKRQSSRPGFVVSDLNSQKPSITLGNRAKDISQVRRQFQSALDIRARAMRNRVRLILSGYAKDVAAGIRVGRKAQQTATAESAFTE